ncbi:hypothetical protein CYMTET_8677 [Cymbomonas tetramitiformis]|uniref:PROP1-like PPR domain-containing protein n=1 Tax=Cymbomonas tetramitiformis TaxID=36881 RepID=A0AAE0LFL5_9CHLO|nr:hypothetical protein CYMTET_8677 [Cymbomonas tetramitiformis]
MYARRTHARYSVHFVNLGFDKNFRAVFRQKDGSKHRETVNSKTYLVRTPFKLVRYSHKRDNRNVALCRNQYDDSTPNDEIVTGKTSSEILDLKTYQEILSKLSKTNSWEEALTLPHRVARQGKDDSTAAYIMLLKVMSKHGAGAQADVVMEAMLRDRVRPDRNTWHAVLRAFGRAGAWPKGRWKEAEELLDTMRKEGVSPDVSVYNPLIKALGIAGHCGRMGALLKVMDVEQVRPDMTTYLTLADAYATNRRWEQAETSFKEALADATSTSSVAAFDRVIKLFTAGGQWHKARKLVQDMETSGCINKSNAYDIVLSAICAAGEWEQASEVMQDMIDAGLQPNSYAQASVVRALSSGRSRGDDNLMAPFD